MIRTPAEVWLGVTRGERDGQQAFFQKAYQAEGDLGLLIRMKNIFSGATASSYRLEPKEKTTVHEESSPDP